MCGRMPLWLCGGTGSGGVGGGGAVFSAINLAMGGGGGAINLAWVLV